MITEDYVSFDTAKLLKEKGFDGPCYKVWESHGESQTLVAAPWFVEGETVVRREMVDAAAELYAYECSLNNKVEGYLAPTLQMAMKWLREAHSLYCQIDCPPFISHEWSYAIRNLDKGEWVTNRYDEEKDTYEEACEAAIRYCLENLI